jgi:Caudovirus prohead protease.
LKGLRGVSVGYLRHVVTRVKAGQPFMGRSFTEETDVTSKWEPFEISIVSVPADADTGVGRSVASEERKLKYVFSRRG